MTDADIKIGIDSRPAEQGGKRVEKSLEDIRKKGKTTFNDMTRESGEANQQLVKMARNMSQAATAAKLLAASWAVNKATELVKELVGVSMQLEGIQVQMRAVTGSMAGARREFDYIIRTSRKFGSELGATADSFAKLSAAAKGTSLQGQAVRDLFESMQGAGTVLQFTAADTTRAIRALEQMISKGKVSAEELRLQLGDALPGAFKLAARAAGVSAQEFDKMLQQGRVMSEDFLPKFSKVLREEFAGGLQDAMNSTRVAINNLQTDLLLMKGAVGDSLLEGGVNESIKTLQDLVSDPMVVEALESWGRVGGRVLSGLTWAFAELTKVVLRAGTVISATADIASLGFAAATIKIQDWLGIISDDVGAAAMADLRKEMEKATAVFTDFEEVGPAALDDAADAAFRATEEVKGLSKEAESFRKTLAKMAKRTEFEAITVSADDLEKELVALAYTVEENQKAFAELGDEGVKLLETVKENIKWKHESIRIYKEEEERVKALEKAQEEYRKMMEKPFENAVSNIQNLFTDTFESILNGGIDSFEDFASSIKKIFIRLAAELATLELGKKVLGGMPGGGSGSMASGSGGLGNLFGNMTSFGGLFGGSAMPGSMFGVSPSMVSEFFVNSLGTSVGTATTASTAFSALSTAMGPAMLGFAGGGMLADLIGGNSTGGSIGGGLGAGAGMLLGGPMGALVGGTLGSLVGSAFGGTPHPASTFGGILGEGGNLRDVELLSKHIGTETATAMQGQLQPILQTLAAAGLSGTGLNITGGVDNGTGFFGVNGTRFNFDPNNAEQANEAIRDLIFEMSELGQITDTELVDVFKRLKAESADLATTLEEILIPSMRRAFDQSIQDRILEILDPIEYQTQQINREFDQLVAEAERLGGSVDAVEELRKLTLETKIANRQQQAQNSQFKELTRAVTDQTQSAERLAGTYLQIGSAINQAITGLRISDISPLSPQDRLKEARSLFSTTASAAQAGDTAAAAQLPALAQEFLRLSREVNATGELFTQDFEMVEKELQKASDYLFDQAQTQLQIADNGRKMLDQLAKANSSLTALVAANDNGSASVDSLTAAILQADNSGVNAGGRSQADLLFGGAITRGQFDAIRRSSTGYTGSFGTGGFDAFLASNSSAQSSFEAAMRQLGIPGFAAGGFMPGGSLGLVGESGPEVVRFGQDARIIPMSGFNSNDNRELIRQFDRWSQSNRAGQTAMVQQLVALRREIGQMNNHLSRERRA